MKIVITGHASGIGKGFYDYYSNRANDIIGFDKFNGYDLGNYNIHSEIIKETQDADIFINNAYVGNVQYKLSKMWFDLNKNRHSLIVNVSSMLVECQSFLGFDSFLELSNTWTSGYVKNKKLLNDFSWQVNFSESLCKALIVSPGIVDTNFIPTVLRSKYKQKQTIISVDEVVSLTVDAISNFNKNTFVPQIFISNTNMNDLMQLLQDNCKIISHDYY